MSVKRYTAKELSKLKGRSDRAYGRRVNAGLEEPDLSEIPDMTNPPPGFIKVKQPRQRRR